MPLEKRLDTSDRFGSFRANLGWRSERGFRWRRALNRRSFKLIFLAGLVALVALTALAAGAGWIRLD